MSFHTNRNDVIETGDDIQDVLGVHVGEENGHKVATLKVLLDPRKDYQAIKELFVHLTNGINHRMIGPLVTAASPVEVAVIPAPAPVTEVAMPVEASTSEATQPLTESTAPATASAETAVGAPTDQGEATTTDEVSTDNSATADTVQLPTVPDGKKGK